MGLLKNLRKRRQEKKAAYRAAKAKALAEAKADAKLQKAKEKYQRKTAKQVRKIDEKELKKRREHDEKMARAAVERAKAGRFNSKNVLRYAAAGRALAPVAIPLAYRAMTQLQNGGAASLSRSVKGSSQDASSGFMGASSSHSARIEMVRNSVNKGVPSGFAKDINERMDVLDEALKNANSMTKEQARGVLASVSRELDLVEAQVAAKS